MPLKKSYPYYLCNKPQEPNADLQVTNKYSGEVATRVALAGPDAIEEAIAGAVRATRPLRVMAPFERQQILLHCVKRFQERFDELAESLCIEAGKPIKDSRGEVTRLIETFQIAANEAIHPRGEMLNLEISPRSKGYRGMFKRVPVGPCSFICPFNFPLNLVAHKVAPAIAAGCPFVLKPDHRTPVGAIIIGEILAETELPPGSFSILPCEVDDAAPFSEDERFKLLSFTGSPQVGWMLKSKAGKKKVVLELGGNAACIVDKGSNLDDVVDRVTHGAFYQSGQSCISVQRILVHESLAADLEERLVASTRKLKSGDPSSEDVSIGPMIAEKEAERLESWIQQAVDAGAKVLCGAERKGSILEATLLKDVPKDQPLCAEEVFGPVAVIHPVATFDEALNIANDSKYGIHAGVFTPSLKNAMHAWDELEVGGVLINEIPSWRVDNIPYGGIKHSGIGREGIRYAIEDMTEIRTLIIRD